MEMTSAQIARVEIAAEGAQWGRAEAAVFPCWMTYCLAKTAVTTLLVSIVAIQVPVPVQPPPLHPKNVKFLFCGVAVSVTIAPAA